MHLRDLLPIIIGIAFFYGGCTFYTDLISPESRVTTAARKNSYFRIFFIATLLMLFFGGLSILMIYGIVWHIELGIFSDVVIGETSGKNLPPGTYSAWALVCLLGGLLVFFGGSGIGILIAGYRGIKLRKNKRR